MYRVLLGSVLLGCLLLGSMPVMANELFTMQPETQTRWASFENPKGEKGKGGLSNRGGKGDAFAAVAPRETVVLMEAQGSGTVHRMWFTLNHRTPQALRSYVLRCYWDGTDKPAVEAPFGDFFGAILGKMTPFQSALFSSPEGRSFNCAIPMPFRKGARITFTNESDEPLEQLFYDINYTLNKAHDTDALYFHAYWQRERWTQLGQDFEILPKVEGAGRFLGSHVGIIGHPDNRGWWGEGEVKMYLDGDTEYPTLVGTGTEDYVGTAYGQGAFSSLYQGSLFVDNIKKRYGFYRHHVPDPVFFHNDIRVTIQQMGGDGKASVVEMLKKKVEIQPVTIYDNTQVHHLLDRKEKVDLLQDKSLPDGWTNMYRRDDVCAVALFYLNAPISTLPPIIPLDKRIEDIPKK